MGYVERERYLAALRAGKNRGEAARAAGVSRGVAVAAEKADPAFRAEVEEAEAEKWEVAEDRLLEAVREGQPWAVKEVLRGAVGIKERWKPEPAVAVGVVVEEIGPGLERVRELEARLRERAGAVGVGVLDVEGRELERPAPE